LVQIIAELYGQGNAIASPVAIAQTWMHLFSAAQDLRYTPIPHLVTATNLNNSQSIEVNPSALASLTAAEAKVLLTSLSQTHIRGTARSACDAAAKNAGGQLLCNGPGTLDIAGKTGTPLFPADQLALPVWRSQCRAVESKWNHIRDKRQAPARLRHLWQRCRVSPIKWYAAVVGHGSRKLVLVVIAERNWYRQTQRVDTALDRGSNVAAEVALAFGVQALVR